MDEGMPRRYPPQDAGSERAILGAMLLRPDALDRALEAALSPDDFALPSHRLIYEAILGLSRENAGVDELTVCSRLEQAGQLEQVGGFPYVAGLAGTVPSLANLGRYLIIVKDLAMKRALLTLADGVQREIFDSGDSALAHLEKVEGKIFELRDAGGGASMQRIGQIAESVYETLRQRAESPSAVTGIPTGFRDLDRLLAGLQKTDLIILAARPSMGKTAFALNVLCNAALRADASVAFFSLEMGADQVVTRMMSSEARVSGGRIRTGELRADDWQPLLMVTEQYANARVFIDDTPGVSVSTVRAKCRRLAQTEGIDLVAVDYLQLMTGEGTEKSREQEISAISRGLKGLAKELKIPVIALSQLNRGVEQRADKRPMMSDLRESGAIEQDADIICFLYRDEYYNPGNPETQGIGEVLVRKQRNGSTGDVKLAWVGEYARFENLERDHP